jgi:4-hydroxy-2-oxoheptanedioate aldolase
MGQHRSSLTTAVQNGEVVHGMWMMSDSADLARIASSVGYGYVCIDMQHGYARADSVVRLSDAIRSGGDALVVARVPDNRFTEIGMLADAGVEAIIVPLVSSVDEARRAVDALAYPDAGGSRSWGPTNALLQTDDAEALNRRPLLLVMVENRAGLEAVEEIAALDGVDGIYVGPSDLAFSLGSRPGPEEPVTTDAIAHVLSVIRQHGKIAAIHCGNGAEAAQRRAQGFTFITTSSDVGAARRAYREDLAIATEPAAEAAGTSAQSGTAAGAGY